MDCVRSLPEGNCCHLEIYALTTESKLSIDSIAAFSFETSSSAGADTASFFGVGDQPNERRADAADFPTASRRETQGADSDRRASIFQQPVETGETSIRVKK
jgi:hypothetical protein